MTEYQRGLEAAAQLIERELKEYRMSADACDAVGNHVGGTNDTVGVLTCQRLAAAIRGLSPQPEPEEDLKVAYGKLFNENAALTGRLEDAEAKLAEHGIYREGDRYVYDGKD